MTNKLPWETTRQLMPWEAPALPAKPLEDIVAALQRDLGYCVTHTAVRVHATGKVAPFVSMLVNTQRGQLIPHDEAKLSDGSTVQFLDLGMPQVGAPTMTVAELVARVYVIINEQGLSL